MNNADKSNNKTMNTEFKGTKGKWQYETIDSGVGLFHCIVQKRNGRIVTYVMNDYPEFIENAKLIADAGNTIQSCGLLPSELLKQRDELRDFLRIIITSETTPISYRKTAKKLLESTEV